MLEGFLGYFTRRYPKLLIYVHEVVQDMGLHHEPMFKSYFELLKSYTVLIPYSFPLLYFALLLPFLPWLSFKLPFLCLLWYTLSCFPGPPRMLVEDTTMPPILMNGLDISPGLFCDEWLFKHEQQRDHEMHSQSKLVVVCQNPGCLCFFSSKITCHCDMSPFRYWTHY